MNQVQAIYERDIGLTFTVSFQHTWDTPNDPYNANGDAVAVLQSLPATGTLTLPPRAAMLTHLWTGRDLGGSAGIAWTGVVCRSPANSYGISDRETMAPFRVGIPAHEIGHNFSAGHSDQAECANTIMWCRFRIKTTRLRFVHLQSPRSLRSSKTIPDVWAPRLRSIQSIRLISLCGNTTQISWAGRQTRQGWILEPPNHGLLVATLRVST